MRTSTKKYKRGAKSLICQSTLKLVTDTLEEHLPKAEAEMVSNQLRNVSLHKSRYRYSPEYQQFLMSILTRSPRAYRFLSKKIRLPPASTVKRWMNRIYFNEGFDEICAGTAFAVQLENVWNDIVGATVMHLTTLLRQEV